MLPTSPRFWIGTGIAASYAFAVAFAMQLYAFASFEEFVFACIAAIENAI